MKPSWVLSDSERDRRFNKRRKIFGGGQEEEEEAKGSRRGDEDKKRRAIVLHSLLPRPKDQPVMQQLTIEDWSAIEKIHNYVK